MCCPRGLEQRWLQGHDLSSGAISNAASCMSHPTSASWTSRFRLDGVAILNELAAQGLPCRILLMSGHGQQVLAFGQRLAEGHHLHIVGCVKNPHHEAGSAVLNSSPMQTFGTRTPGRRRCHPQRTDGGRYQPIVDLPNHQVVAAEALARWQHPTEGLFAAFGLSLQARS